MTTGSCARHQMEIEDGECSSCRRGYCAQCLVYVHGTSKPPMCVQCALSRAGVRTGNRPMKRGMLQRWRDTRLEKQAAAAVQRARIEAQAHAAGVEPEAMTPPPRVRDASGWGQVPDGAPTTLREAVGPTGAERTDWDGAAAGLHGTDAETPRFRTA